MLKTISLSSPVTSCLWYPKLAPDRPRELTSSADRRLAEHERPS